MVRGQNKPFDPEAPVARPGKHVYVNNGRRQQSGADGGLGDDTLTQLLEMELESMDVPSRKARDISSIDSIIKRTAKAYRDRLWNILDAWQEAHKEAFDWKSPDLTEDGERLYPVSVMFNMNAAYLYFMEAEGHGVGTWDGDWDDLFKDSNKSIKQLSAFVKKESHNEYQELKNALEERASELMVEHDVSMEQNPRKARASTTKKSKKKATKSHEITLYANPYSTMHTGFYFHDMKEFKAGMAALRKRGAEEVELDFIDGSDEDVDLFNELKISQGNVDVWFDVIMALSEYEKAGLYALHANGETNLEKMVDTIEDDNPIRFEGNVKEYAENLIDDTGDLNDAVEKIKESREKLRDKKQYSEYEQFINSYFNFDSFGESIKNGILTGSDDEADQERVEEMSDEEVGEEYVNDVGWDGVGDDNIKNFFDMDRYARDLELNGDVGKMEFAGKTWVYSFS
jgi:hypothetical protein